MANGNAVMNPVTTPMSIRTSYESPKGEAAAGWLAQATIAAHSAQLRPHV
jgi:hypothetical protein